MGACVYIYFGVRIGQEGFGFASTTDRFLSVPRLGEVVLEDDVEVCANATFDRGSSRDTAIDAGCRLNNLVQIRKCYPQPKLRHHRTSTVLEDFVCGGRRQWPGIFGLVEARRSPDGRASSRMWFQGAKVLAALLAKKRLLPANCLAQEDGKGRRVTRLVPHERFTSIRSSVVSPKRTRPYP